MGASFIDALLSYFAWYHSWQIYHLEEAQVSQVAKEMRGHHSSRDIRAGRAIASRRRRYNKIVDIRPSKFTTIRSHRNVGII